MLSGQYWMVNDDVLFYLPGCKKRPLGQPGALQPAAGVCQHLRQLVWLHASGPLSVSLGPCALQRSSVCPAQEVQRLGESVKMTDEMDRKTRKQHQRLVWWPSGQPNGPISGGQSRWDTQDCVGCGQSASGVHLWYGQRTIIRQTLVDCSGLYTYKYEEKRA